MPKRGRGAVQQRKWRRPLFRYLPVAMILAVAGWVALPWVSLPQPPEHRARAPAVATLPALSPTPVPTPTPVEPQAVIPRGLPAVYVPILEYHYVRVNPNPRDQLGFNLSVTPDNFAAQMDWLGIHGYHPIDLRDLRGYLAGQEDLPPQPVVLTFDDGYRDFYTTAWPLLREHDFKAVSYVVPGFLGGRNYMTPEQVKELDRAGIEIASHTVHHFDLTKLDPGTLNVELQASRGYLEELLGHPVQDFCYPSGKYNSDVEAAVAVAGYQSATGEGDGTLHSLADRLAWTRVRVRGGEQLPDFAASLGPVDPTQVVASPVLPQAGLTPAPADRGDRGAVP
ncbi:MAG: polysaccharide deacetylase family protein [Candidatus Dormibacteraeota bacterium]|nr:polysaccharide deacetylase family protein [Candidatus Dormibacteraeota bacterium]